MHLQQTKRESRKTGGPQYYFHDLTEDVKKYLRDEGSVHVALTTPYGATQTQYVAVSADKNLVSGLPVSGSVGHDRIQQGGAPESIGEAIRKWYLLPAGDFERIDVEIEVRDNEFYITPIRCKYAGSDISQDLILTQKPLTFTHDYQSPFWKRQILAREEHSPGVARWALSEICRIMQDHRPKTKLPHIQETDILRASGPLWLLGMKIGGYVGRGYDCETQFQFLGFPEYSIPVEIKKESKGFVYQQDKYPDKELSRSVVLCALHNHKTMPAHIDVIELDALCAHAQDLPLLKISG
jgi:hypothetical protein